jgi:hypothetical protein
MNGPATVNGPAARLTCASVAPQVEARAGQPNKILHGWMKNGMTDSMSMRTPDLRTMTRGMLRWQMTEKERQLHLDNFVELLVFVCLHGHVPDKEFFNGGFPANTNHAGEEVPRLAGISQERCQRAKTLSHEHQVKLRADLVEEKMASERKKQEEANAGVATGCWQATPAAKKGNGCPCCGMVSDTHAKGWSHSDTQLWATLPCMHHPGIKTLLEGKRHED